MANKKSSASLAVSQSSEPISSEIKRGLALEEKLYQRQDEDQTGETDRFDFAVAVMDLGLTQDSEVANLVARAFLAGKAISARNTKS